MTLSKPPLTVTLKSGRHQSSALSMPHMTAAQSVTDGAIASIGTGDRLFAKTVDAQLVSEQEQCWLDMEREKLMANNQTVEGIQRHVGGESKGIQGGVLPVAGVNPYNPLSWQQTPLQQGQQLGAGAVGYTPGKKLDSGKAPVAQGFIAYFRKAMEAVAKVSEYGSKKYKVAYSDQNWRRVEDAKNRYADALARHFAAYVAGETHDPESGLPHLDHVSWNANALIELREAQSGK